MTIVASFASKRCRAPPPPKIILRVINPHLGTQDMFRMCTRTQLKKLMRFYCDKRNLDYTTVRFIYNTILLGPRQSPGDLMMQDYDIIAIDMSQQQQDRPSSSSA